MYAGSGTDYVHGTYYVVIRGTWRKGSGSHSLSFSSSSSSSLTGTAIFQLLATISQGPKLPVQKLNLPSLFSVVSLVY